MPFKPGHNIGRTSGSKNKASEVKKIIASVGAAFKTEEIIEDLKSMSPRSRIDALQNIWKYIEPTKKSVEVEEFTPEDQKEEYIQRLRDIPLENFNKYYGNN